MFRRIRQLVSGDKVRFDVGNVSLDLTYITDRIIAMGFPATGIEGVYRNHIDDVSAMLKAHHGTNYMIWNLTERNYEYEKFDNQILEFPFPDHHSPPLALLFKIVHSIDGWLTADPKNVAVVHCLAGRGRTGTVISAFLMYTGLFPSTLDALKHFAVRRSQREQGVTNPAQRRYVSYFDDLLVHREWVPQKHSLIVRKVVFSPVPNMDGTGCRPLMQVFDMSQKTKKLLFSTAWNTRDVRHFDWAEDKEVEIPLDCPVQGDVMIKCQHSPVSVLGGGDQYMWRVLFHTGFHVEGGSYVLKREEVDGAHKDKRFPPTFVVRVELEVDEKKLLSEDQLLAEKDFAQLVEMTKEKFLKNRSKWEEKPPPIPVKPEGISSMLLKSRLEEVMEHNCFQRKDEQKKRDARSASETQGENGMSKEKPINPGATLGVPRRRPRGLSTGLASMGRHSTPIPPPKGNPM